MHRVSLKLIYCAAINWRRDASRLYNYQKMIENCLLFAVSYNYIFIEIKSFLSNEQIFFRDFGSKSLWVKCFKSV